MKAVIIGTVPTGYQSNSIRSFGIPVTKHRGGCLEAYQEFDTIKEAREYLINQAYKLYDENINDLKEAIRNIKKGNFLSYDAATVYIERKCI